MPDLVQKTITFKNGKRIDLHTVYESPSIDPLNGFIVHVDDVHELVDRELHYKALFLRTLSRMLAEKGYNASAEQLFVNRLGNILPIHDEEELRIYGSQTLLRVRDFSKRPLPADRRNESTTSYKFNFAFNGLPLEEGYVSSPIFDLDVRAVNQLRDHGVSEALLEKWGKGFLKMAGMAEHDYLHQSIESYKSNGSARFLLGELSEQKRQEIRKKRLPDPGTGDYREDHALTLHAQIVKRLFEEVPRRKTRVLEWAVEAYSDLQTMQTQALSTCKTDAERHDMNEAITYFAEIYSHRLFRVISPEDKTLRMSPDPKTSKSKTSISVAGVMNKLVVVEPDRRIEEHSLNYEPLPRDGLERLARHCEDWLGNT